MSEPKSGMLLSEEEIREAARLAGIDADKVIGYPSGMEPFELAFARRIEAAVLRKWGNDLMTNKRLHTVFQVEQRLLGTAAEAEEEAGG
jgi:hypothetical protein